MGPESAAITEGWLQGSEEMFAYTVSVSSTEQKERAAVDEPEPVRTR